MADFATLQTWLSEAQAARHALMTGAAVVSISERSGTAVTYRGADIAKLERYIADLQSQIAALQGAASQQRRPILPEF